MLQRRRLTDAGALEGLMLDPGLLRAEPARVRAGLARRGEPTDILDRAVELDTQWVAQAALADSLRTRRRRVSEEVSRHRGEGADASDLERLGREVAEKLRAVEHDLRRLQTERDRVLLDLPNLPASDVPEETLVLNAPPPPLERGGLAHWDLLKFLNLADTADASAGRGFLIWRGAGVRLLRALETFMLDLHTREFAYEEVRCPVVATRAALEGSAHLPALEEKMYAVDKNRSLALAAGKGNELFLAPRAEPHLANLFRGKILDAGALPARFVAAGPALRREAEHGGRRGRGLLRLHEFPTVEVYAFCRPEESEAELARAVEAADRILERLGLAHRRLLRGARRLSRAAAKTIDLEVWAPALGEWLGVAALSAFTDYQARRTRTRFRDADGKTHLVHTVGGAAVALPHLVAAILENGQQKDGSVRLPDALGPYMGGETVLVPVSGDAPGAGGK